MRIPEKEHTYRINNMQCASYTKLFTDFTDLYTLNSCRWHSGPAFFHNNGAAGCKKIPMYARDLKLL